MPKPRAKPRPSPSRRLVLAPAAPAGRETAVMIAGHRFAQIGDVVIWTAPTGEQIYHDRARLGELLDRAFHTLF